MRFLIYCQHVLGIGHLFRTMEIARALSDQEVLLVLGGPEASVAAPPQVQIVHLPGLFMDAEFHGLQSTDPGRSLMEIQDERVDALLSCFNRFNPDCLLVELYPFGRNAFHFELQPLLVRARAQGCPTVSSVRDILVERDKPEKFEQRVLDRLHRFFDLLLIHADPRIIGLDATFARFAEIRIPVRYTGYVCQTPSPSARTTLRRQLGLADGDRLLVISAGGGSVGAELLQAAVRAVPLLSTRNTRTHIFTGPYLDQESYDRLCRDAGDRCQVSRFTDRFPDWLAAADGSVSMGGYNTTLNTLAAGCPALILPFAQNHEQRLRLMHLCRWAPVLPLVEDDLAPSRLAGRIDGLLQHSRAAIDIQLDGACRSAELLRQIAGGGLA